MTCRRSDFCRSKNPEGKPSSWLNAFEKWQGAVRISTFGRNDKKGRFANNFNLEQRKNRDYAQSQYRPTSQFNYRARCPARLLNWRSIRNNYTLLDRA